MEKQSNVRIMFNGNSGKVTVIAKGEKKALLGRKSGAGMVQVQRC